MLIGMRQAHTSPIPLVFENQKLFPVPFTPKDVISFAYTHQPFAPGPTLYYALVHKFGYPMVEEAFDQLASSFVDM